MTNPSTRQQPVAPGGPRFEREVPTTSPAPVEARNDQVLAAAGLGVVAGIWLIIAPFVLGYGDGDPTWNDIIFGAVTIVLSAIRITMPRITSWAGWLMALVGAWVFASAFWLDDTATASWNDIILGIIVFILGVASAATMRRRS
jgi:hypothetical protein